jgi:hypothetical protein
MIHVKVLAGFLFSRKIIIDTPIAVIENIILINLKIVDFSKNAKFINQMNLIVGEAKYKMHTTIDKNIKIFNRNCINILLYKEKKPIPKASAITIMEKLI